MRKFEAFVSVAVSVAGWKSRASSPIRCIVADTVTWRFHPAPRRSLLYIWEASPLAYAASISHPSSPKALFTASPAFPAPPNQPDTLRMSLTCAVC